MELEQAIKQTKFRNQYQKAGLNIIYTASWVEAKFKDFLKNYQITLQQFNILKILNGQKGKPISISDIKDRMLDLNSDVSRIVERMRKKNWVLRNISENDRRMMQVVISEEGTQLLKEIESKHEQLDKVLTKLEPKELETLNHLLDKIRT